MEVCAICHESTIVQPVTLDPCGHTFCGLCIVRWLRTRGGEKVCPLCRDAGVDVLEDTITAGDAHERARVLLRLSRRKSASKLLKQTVVRYRRTQEKATTAARELHEFRVAHREELKEYNRLCTRKWQMRRKERVAKKRIGFSVFEDDLPVPVVTGWSWYFRARTVADSSVGLGT
jgi:hypothetical protein